MVASIEWLSQVYRVIKCYNTGNKLITSTIIKSCNKISFFKITLHYKILLFTQPVLFFETHKKVSNKLNVPIIYCTLKKKNKLLVTMQTMSIVNHTHSQTTETVTIISDTTLNKR